MVLDFQIPFFLRAMPSTSFSNCSDYTMAFADVHTSTGLATMTEGHTPCIASTSVIFNATPPDVFKELTGCELMLLQGLPLYKLRDMLEPSRRRFSNKQLKYLAGNALRGSVCIAVLLLLFIDVDWLWKLDDCEDTDPDEASNAKSDSGGSDNY